MKFTLEMNFLSNGRNCASRASFVRSITSVIRLRKGHPTATRQPPDSHPTRWTKIRATPARSKCTTPINSVSEFGPKVEIFRLVLTPSSRNATLGRARAPLPSRRAPLPWKPATSYSASWRTPVVSWQVTNQFLLQHNYHHNNLERWRETQ